MGKWGLLFFRSTCPLVYLLLLAMIIKRLGHGPIIYPELNSSMGTNINGPSLIRMPDWLPDRLGTYYLSKRSAVHHRARQLRDPGIFKDEDRLFLLYAVRLRA